MHIYYIVILCLHFFWVRIELLNRNYSYDWKNDQHKASYFIKCITLQSATARRTECKRICHSQVYKSMSEYSLQEYVLRNTARSVNCRECTVSYDVILQSCRANQSEIRLLLSRKHRIHSDCAENNTEFRHNTQRFFYYRYYTMFCQTNKILQLTAADPFVCLRLKIRHILSVLLYVRFVIM